MGSCVNESDVERRWDDLVGRHWYALWIVGQSAEAADARKALWHFFNEVENELTPHRIAIAHLRREVEALQKQPKWGGRPLQRLRWATPLDGPCLIPTGLRTRAPCLFGSRLTPEVNQPNRKLSGE